jgi:hypothetical protein
MGHSAEGKESHAKPRRRTGTGLLSSGWASLAAVHLAQNISFPPCLEAGRNGPESPGFEGASMTGLFATPPIADP